MVSTPTYEGRQSLAEEDLPVDTARQEEKRKTTKIMEEPSLHENFMRLHEKQNPERRYGREQTSLAFGSGRTSLGCISPNNKNNNNFYIEIDKTGSSELSKNKRNEFYGMF